MFLALFVESGNGDREGGGYVSVGVDDEEEAALVVDDDDDDEMMKKNESTEH